VGCVGFERCQGMWAQHAVWESWAHTLWVGRVLVGQKKQCCWL